MIHFENSADLSLGRRPKLKSAEFSKCIILVVELLRCENTGFHIHAAPFGTRSLPAEAPLEPLFDDAEILARGVVRIDPAREFLDHARNAAQFSKGSS